MLMDLFCEHLDSGSYLRLHFHRFMAMIHQQLFQHSGQPDPLSFIAKELATKYNVICFDEFYVTDIGDAMLLGRLYKSLFKAGMTIISTSNARPDELYTDGLHRDRFIPTIKLIEDRMNVMPLDNGQDHRHRNLTHQQAYFINDESPLNNLYQQLTGAPPTECSIWLCGRELACRGKKRSVIWFDFNQLCEGPRSSQDYIELAERFETVLLSSVPCFKGVDNEQIKARGTEDGTGKAVSTGNRRVVHNQSDDGARRFISLVDELYDCRVNLFVSAEEVPENLYQGHLLSLPFNRTLSRLQEMGSAEYQKLTDKRP